LIQYELGMIAASCSLTDAPTGTTLSDQPSGRADRPLA
jgi:hypothetical protein